MLKRVSPAGAGMDRPEGQESEGEDRFPRRRGDGPPSGAGRISISSFPPQARGWTRTIDSCAQAIKVSPAGAGMDLREAAVVSVELRFPRRRGDGPFYAMVRINTAGFPPQARGWTIHCRHVR